MKIINEIKNPNLIKLVEFDQIVENNPNEGMPL